MEPAAGVSHLEVAHPVHPQLMRVQLAWTMLTEILVTISSIFLLKVVVTMLGAAGFGEYTLTRRAVNLLYLPLVLGLGIATPRYIAIVRAGALADYSQGAFAIAALTAGLVPMLAAALLLNLAPGLASTILFGNTDLTHMIAPATIALVGLALHTIVYAIYRGQSRMRYANALQIINVAIAPLAVFGFAGRTARDALLATGTAWVIVSGINLLVIVSRERTEWPAADNLIRHIRVLLRYGIPRVPGEFALVGLFAIPALIAVRAHGIVPAGQFSAAISVLMIAAGGFAPVGLVVLPRASAQAATGDLEGVRHLVVRMLGVGILLAVAGVIAGELLIPFFVRWYFGPEFVPAIPVFQACLLGAIPYAVYILMRNILDALDVKAVNSRNLMIALALLTVLCLVDSGMLWMSASLVAALSVLAGLTLHATWTRLRARPGTAPVAA